MSFFYVFCRTFCIYLQPLFGFLVFLCKGLLSYMVRCQRILLCCLWTALVQVSIAQSAFLGIYSDRVSDEKAHALGIDNPYGFYVRGIVKHSAAHLHGIKVLDYIFGVNEFRTGENQDLIDVLKRIEAGEEVELHLMRNGRKITKKIELTERFQGEKLKASGDSFLGVVLLKGFPEVPEYGIQVKVVPGSPADQMGILTNDVIMALNGHRIVDWQDLGYVLDMYFPKDEVEVWLERGNHRKRLNGRLGVQPGTKLVIRPDSYEYGEDFEDENTFDHEHEIHIRHAIKNRTERSEIGYKRNVEEFNARFAKIANEQERQSNLQRMGIAQKRKLNLKNLEIWRNENLGAFSIGFYVPDQGDIKIKVFNEEGQALYENYLHNFFGSYSDNLDLVQFGTEELFLYVEQNNNQFIGKIVVYRD